MADDDSDVPVRVVDRRWWARGEADTNADEARLRKPTYVEELERQLAEKTAQLQTYTGEHRRAMEDLDQVRARLRRDAAREVERARRAVLGALLEVVDNLDRAIDAARESGDVGTLLQGVDLVRQQFLAKLAALGVTRVPALGAPFDATQHEAISTMPVADPAQDGIVVQVAKEGYVIGDDVLRPASVVVGRQI